MSDTKYYVKNELYHHGIKGQQWGKKNGPPYPLGASDHSASEKKAGWRDSLDKNVKNNVSKMYQENLNISKEDADAEAAKRQDTIKKILIGTAIAAGVAGGIYIYRQYGRNYVDDVIKAGTKIDTLSSFDDRMEEGRGFFTAHRNFDKMKYRGLFGMDFINGYKHDIQATAKEDMKIASTKTAKKSI